MGLTTARSPIAPSETPSASAARVVTGANESQSTCVDATSAAKANSSGQRVARTR